MNEAVVDRFGKRLGWVAQHKINHLICGLADGYLKRGWVIVRAPDGTGHAVWRIWRAP